jgi:hypothetical protein
MLSLADLGLTWLMVERLDGASEANPLAARILEQFGWIGLALHKLGCVGVVLGIAAILVKRRPRLGRLVVRVGCGSALVVVGYSMWLLLSPSGLLSWSDELDQAERQAVNLRRLHLEQHRFVDYSQDLTKLLARGEIALPTAASSLNNFLTSCDHDPLRYLPELFDELRGEACLAAYLVHKVGWELSDDPDQAQQRLEVLAREFAHYRVPLPEQVRASFAPATVWVSFRTDSPSQYDALPSSAETSQAAGASARPSARRMKGRWTSLARAEGSSGPRDARHSRAARRADRGLPGD